MINGNVPSGARVIEHQRLVRNGRPELRSYYAVGNSVFMVESVDGSCHCPISLYRLAGILGITHQELQRRLKNPWAVADPWDAEKVNLWD